MSMRNGLAWAIALCLACAIAIVPGAQRGSAADALHGEPPALDQASIAPAMGPDAPDWWDESDQADSMYGAAVAGGCDVNGDGYDDVIVGGLYYQVGTTYRSGRAWLYLGSASGLSATPDRVFDPPYLNTNGFFGTSVACAGDVDGNGYDDLIIGMDNFESTGSTADEGAAYVYYGGASGPSTTPSWHAEGEMQWGHLGAYVSGAGDVNNDGYDDILVGGYYYNMNYGGAWVWHGGPGGLGATGTPTNADWKVTGWQYGMSLAPVSSAGDVNGDGCDDILVGAPAWDNGETDEGGVFVWLGSTGGVNGGVDGTSTNYAWRAEGEGAGRRLGEEVGTLGDVNGDGYDDVIVGDAGFWASDDLDDGLVLAFYGSATGLGANGTPSTADWKVQDAVDGEKRAFSVQRDRGADVNGDGYDDALVGLSLYNVITGTQTLTDAGAILIWFGSAQGLRGDGTIESAALTAGGDQVGGWLGRALNYIGDVNADGYVDIVAGARYYDHGQSNEGRAFAYYGPWARIYLSIVLRNAP
ncbi:MAG: FG-GAP repeat protein [Anaerolineae bacterium]|nr:FG-GAP repeat protein [Anaerolineae bacterium]